MAKAIDPFEEYLRKKKVEMLEQQFRSQKERPSGTAQEEPAPPETVPTNDDPDVEARLKEEVDDFFQDSQSAAAELFTKAASMSDDKVEEIKDALDEVFEEDEPRPETTEDEGGTFVDFFRQVQEEFPGKDRRRAQRSVVGGVPQASSTAAAEVEADTEAAVPSVSAPAPRPAAMPDLDAMAAEVSSEDLGVEEDAGGHDADRLSLSEILLAKPGAVNLERKVEVLIRLVGKLAERAGLSESELVEALIKAGVEF